MMKKILYIIQIDLNQGRANMRNNVWKVCIVLFFMALISVYSSFSMDKKIIKKHTNDKYLEQLKSSFVANKKRVNDLREDIIIQVKEKNFGFIEPLQEDVIMLLK